MQQKNNHLLNLACHFKKQICSTQWKTSNIVKVTKLNYHWKKPPKWTKYNLQLKWIPYNTIYIYWYIYHILYIHVVRIHHFIFVNTTFWSLLQFQFHQIQHEKGPRNPLKTLEITVSSCSNVIMKLHIFVQSFPSDSRNCPRKTSENSTTLGSINKFGGWGIPAVLF